MDFFNDGSREPSTYNGHSAQKSINQQQMQGVDVLSNFLAWHLRGEIVRFPTTSQVVGLPNFVTPRSAREDVQYAGAP